MDYQDRLVASSLIGVPNTDTLALLSQQDLGLSDSTQNSSITQDFLANSSQSVLGNSITYYTSLFNESGGESSMSYAMEYMPYGIACDSITFYLQSALSIDLSLVDDCEEIIIHKELDFIPTSLVDTVLNPVTMNHNADFYLAEGVYYIDKKLFIDESTVNSAVEEYLGKAIDMGCLFSEDYFIRKSVESKEFPCMDIIAQDSIDCFDLQAAMMEELWPNLDGVHVERKYGFYSYPSSSTVANSVIGNGNSIFTLYDKATDERIDFDSLLNSVTNNDNYIIYENPQIIIKYSEGNLTKPLDSIAYYYRYQSDCVDPFPTIMHQNQIYTNIKDLPVSVFISIFNDAIAEHLLPLHPEYCDLLACVDDPYEAFLEQLENAATAEALGYFNLMDIIDKDPIKAKMDTLGLSAYDSLAFAFTSPGYSLSAIDTFALQYTYCLTNIDEAQEFCEEFYADKIAQMEFPNAYFKDAYYEKMLGMYLTNRQQYKHFLNPQFSSASCTCPYQMELSGPGLNVFFDPYEHWMNNPYFTDSLGFDFNNIIDSFLLNNPGDTTGLAQIQDSVQYLYDSVNTVNCVARVDYIFSNFSSCGPEVNLSALKNFFIAICSDTSEVLSDYLEPEIFDSLFTAFGIAQDAFCHVYLLDFISPNGSSGQSGNDFSCLFPVDFYADWEQFLMSLSLEQYSYLSGSQNYSLDTQNLFEKELSFHLGTVIQVVSSYQNSILNLHFTNGIDTISQFIPIENMNATINTLQFKVACALEQENISGQIVQGYLLSQMVVVTAAIDQQIHKTHAWISSPFLSLRPEAGGIERAITPKVLLSAWDSYEQWAKPYGLTHWNHPLFAKSLTNFLNYKWKKHFDYTAIPQYIESVELHKKRTILSTGSYGVLRFSNSTSLENFTNYLFTTFGHTEMVAWKEDNNKVGVDLREVADSLYRGLDSVLQNYNNGVEERWINLPFLHSIEDSNTYAVLYVDPSSYSTPLNSLTVFGTQVDWSIVSQGSVLLEWQNENASNYHKYLIKYQGQNEAELSNLAMYIEDFMESHAISYRLLSHRPLLRYMHNQSAERTAFLQKAFAPHLLHSLQSYDSLQIPALKDNPFNNYDYIAYGPSFLHLNKRDLYYNSDL